MTTHFKAGDDVPREWFSRLENLAWMRFGCDCEMKIRDGKRLVRRTSVEGECMLRMQSVGSHPDQDGTIKAEADPPILWINHDGNGLWEDANAENVISLADRSRRDR